jgi:TonB-dependent receptor
MKISKSSILFMSLTMLFTLSFTSLNAQVTGTIAGRVTDASSGAYLPGANVMIRGTNFGDATDREGEFTIANVPPGTYTLVVGYIGYDDFSTEVRVTAGAKTRQDVALNVSYVEGEEVVVEGLRQGQVKALSQQRMAENIKNVVAQEQMERFPDINTAEVLQRVPGVFIERSQGEGRYVYVRGTAPGLSYVTVNGEKLATNRVEERYAQLDIIAASQLASVEVTKAITPDMDGDAIGGSINLVTRSAFDYPGSRMSLSIGPGYARIDKKLIGQGKLDYSNQFGANKNFGFTFSANWDSKQRGTDGMEFTFDETEDVNDNPIPFALSDFDLRDYRRTRTRYGFGSDLEYRPNDNHQWFVRGMYSRLKDQQWRGRWRIRAAGNFLSYAANEALTERSRIVMVHTQRLEDLNQINLSGGGLHKLGNKELNYTFAYSYANEEHPDQLESEWLMNTRINLQLNLADKKYPKWTIASLDNSYQYDAANYDLDAMDYRSTYANNWQYVGSMNFKMPYNLGNLPSEFKLGFKLRMDEKDRDEDRWRLRWRGDDLTLNQFLADYKDPDFMNGNYEYGPGPDGDKLQDFYEANVDGDLERELRLWDSEAQNYNNIENIYAYYAMTTVNMGDFMLLGGFRHELTKGEYKGKKILLDADGNLSSLDPVTVDRDYNNFLPMFHVRYRLTPMSNIRAAFTQTISRPNYWFVTPYYYLDPDGEEIRQGNPDLKPTTAMNLDLMAEHYFQKVGVVSGGFFYKKLNDISFERVSTIVGGTFDDFDLEEPINGGDATLYGFELAWNQELSFLPGFLNGFGIYTNYTHTWADADLGFDRKGFLPGQSGDIANVSLSYDKYGFSARISAMYQDKFLQTVGKNEDWDEWKDSHFQLDFSATYNLLPWAQIYLEAVNLTNEPVLEYYGIPDRPRLLEYYSWWMQGGIKITR